MSNFKERHASAKKVIQLQNEILSLKQKLSASKKPQDPEPCKDCQKLLQEVESILNSKNEEFSLLQEEIASLKADLKKVRSENTRLKKKIKEASSEDDA